MTPSHSPCAPYRVMLRAGSGGGFCNREAARMAPALARAADARCGSCTLCVPTLQEFTDSAHCWSVADSLLHAASTDVAVQISMAQALRNKVRM